jgi:hypothetical protein
MFDDATELARTRQLVDVLRAETESLRAEKIELLAQLNFAVNQVNLLATRNEFDEDTLVEETRH